MRVNSLLELLNELEELPLRLASRREGWTGRRLR